MKGLAVYIGFAERSELALSESFRQVALGHLAEAEIAHTSVLLACWCDQHVERLASVRERYGDEPDSEPERLHAVALSETRSGPVGLIRDLQDLYTLCALTESTWTVLGQAARGARDEELQSIADECGVETARQQKWCQTQLKSASPQALLAARE